MQSKTQSHGRLLTVEQAAAELGLKPKTLRQQIWKRTIQYHKIGGAVRISSDTINQILERSIVPALELR